MVIMTHGEFGTLLSYRENYNIDKVFSYFSDDFCSSLKGKPRLFFIQACRGKKVDKGHVMEIEEDIVMRYELHRVPFGVNNSTERDTNPFEVEAEAFDFLHEPYNHKNFLIVRSTMPDYVSFRIPNKGSWFIQSLCKELDVNGTNEDILTLLTNVNLSVQEQESNPEKEKQILTISSMLTKLLVFDVKPRKVQVEIEAEYMEEMD
jgi:Caspase domain